MPVLRIKASNLQLRKAQGATFYEAAKKEDGMLSYGYSYGEAGGGGEVHFARATAMQLPCWRTSALSMCRCRLRSSSTARAGGSPWLELK